MFFKNRKQPKVMVQKDTLFDSTYNLPSYTNLVYVNQAEHAKLFIEGYAQQNGLKNIYHLNPADQYFNFDASTPSVYKKSDLVIYEPECYIIGKHAALMSNKVCNHEYLKKLPKHQIIITYTSNMVHKLSEGMETLRRRYSKKIPSGITSLNLHDRAHVLLVLINNS